MLAITETIPYEDAFITYKNDEELVKFLVLSVPYSPKNVESVINLMIYLLQDEATFYRNFFVSVIQIAMIHKKGCSLLEFIYQSNVFLLS